MNKPVKTKLCWNCEGNVSRSAENCPYCAVYLSPENEDLQEETAPLAPPYPKATLSKEIPKAPYTQQEESSEDVIEEPASTFHFQAAFLPLIFLTTGLISLFFSFMLFLFSENGKLTLQWDGDIWYVYSLIALPLLFFGWRFLDQE